MKNKTSADTIGITRNIFIAGVLTWAFWLIMNVIRITLRIRVRGSGKNLLAHSHHRSVILVLWHGRQFIPALLHAHQNMGALVSPSRDGLLVSKVLSLLGYTPLFGSSNEFAASVLLKAKRMITEGRNLAITADGPKGPCYRFKPGAMYLAHKTRAVLLPVTFSASSAHIFHSWDHFMLPRPFSRILVLYGQPYEMPRTLGISSIRQECRKLEQRLNEMTREADVMIRKKK